MGLTSSSRDGGGDGDGVAEKPRWKWSCEVGRRSAARRRGLSIIAFREEILWRVEGTVRGFVRGRDVYSEVECVEL